MDRDGHTLALRAFASREVAQVWARDLRDGSLVHLPEGGADRHRPVAREHLVCPVPACASPFSTRGGSRRDHFVHLRDGSGHGDGESVFHLQAKAVLADWARRQAPDASVREEQTLKDPAAARDRRPDVLATWPDGTRVAFEVEYKQFPVQAWRDKQVDLEAVSPPVVTVWLFGHLPRYLAPVPRPARLPEAEPWEQVAVRELPQAVAGHGLPVLHVNPLDATLGTVVVDGADLDEVRGRERWWETWEPGRVGLRLPGGSDWQGRLVVDRLEDCRLVPGRGLVTPAMRQVDADRDRVALAAAEDAAAWQAGAAARAAAAEQAARTATDRRAYAQAAAQRDRDRWLADPMRAAIVRAHGAVPAVLAARLPEDRGVLGDPEHWHCVAWRDLVHGSTGRTWTVPQVYAVIAQTFRLHPHPGRRSAAVNAFLHHLRDHGAVEFDSTGSCVLGSVRIVSDSLTPAPPPPPAAAPPRSPAPSPAAPAGAGSGRSRPAAPPAAPPLAPAAPKPARALPARGFAARLREERMARLGAEAGSGAGTSAGTAAGVAAGARTPETRPLVALLVQAGVPEDGARALVCLLGARPASALPHPARPAPPA